MTNWLLIADTSFNFAQACELIAKQTEDVFLPLIELLVQRLSFVMTRVPLVVENILEAKESAAAKKENKVMD